MPLRLPRPAPGDLASQAAIAALACLTFLLLGAGHIAAFATLRGEAAVPDRIVAEIGLEHDGPVRIGFDIARKEDGGVVRIQGDENARVLVSLPEDWERTTVYGAKPDEVTAEEPAFGFVRWTLPAGAGMRLQTERIADELRFLSPSTAIATVTMITVDLRSEVFEERTILVQHESAAGLWDEE